MRELSPRHDHECKRCRAPVQIDLDAFGLETTDMRNAEVGQVLSHVEPIHECKHFVGAWNHLGREVLPALLLWASSNALNCNHRRDDRDAQGRDDSLHDRPHASDSLRPRFASDISRRDSYRPVTAFAASVTNLQGRMPKLTE